MKYRKYVILISLTVMILNCSCKDDSDTEETTASIELSETELSYSYEGGSDTIEVSSNVEWGAYTSEDWCSVSSSGGLLGDYDIVVETEYNNTGEIREATITFKSGSYKQIVNVTQGYYGQEIDFGDDAFETFCVENFDLDGDGAISSSEASQVTSMNASGLGISSLSALSFFYNLTSLDVSDNSLSSLDVSDLTSLESLDCSNNDLTELDIEINVSLTTLDCTGNNNLTSIYVWSGFTASSDFQKPDGASYIEPEITTPAGYTLVWQDEFNDAKVNGKNALPDTDLWNYETGDGGWGNNELQNYISAVQGSDTCAFISDGTLKIVAKKVDDEILSIRMNTSESWTYGYFEARLKLPGGTGTWPAFWMMPKNYTSWPEDGEIDIMEEVGYNPNYISSSIHCLAYYHSIGTQKTSSVYVENAESEFHVYAVEWTEDYIYGYVDGEVYFQFENDHEDNYDTWPFDNPFYLKLNLAWGGDWGGAEGVDESALPATYEVDYVRVFQK